MVESPITVTAMALEADGAEAIFVSCDIGDAKSYLINLARRRCVELVLQTETATQAHGFE